MAFSEVSAVLSLRLPFVIRTNTLALSALKGLFASEWDSWSTAYDLSPVVRKPRVPNFHGWGGCCANLAHCALSGQPVQEVAVSTFHLHLPLSVTCVGRGLYFLSDRDSSSTAECRLSLCMSQLLCQCQLHAGAAYQPLPFLSTTHLHLKETIKERNLSFVGLGETWGKGGHFLCSWFVGVFFPS